MFTNILVPLDGSELAEQAVPKAQTLAQSFNATVHLVHVVSRNPEMEALRVSGDINVQEMETNLELARQLVEGRVTRGKEFLERAASQLESAGVEAKVAVTEGAPHESIISYSKENRIDLIVMSTRGYGGVKRLLLGSTTDRVIRSCETPVLVLPCS